uniref:Uncharacterized protein n=1 Tax=Salix viminalis TaxID=40686 RepID=A0A6N2KDM2_SALVM
MDAPMSSKSLISMVIYGFLLLSLCNSLKDNAVDGTRAYFHTLKINSLPSTDVCKESSKAPNEGSSSLKLVHKFGPCNTSVIIARLQYLRLVCSSKME